VNNKQFDVVVVGAGNAAFSAASAASEAGARVVVLEKAPLEHIGGNSLFTRGSFRTAHNGKPDILPLLSEAEAASAENLEIPPYTAEQFTKDMIRLTNGRTDRVMMHYLVQESLPTVQWLRELGIRWTLQTDNQSFEVNGKRILWGGTPLETVDGGKGLIADHIRAAEERGVTIKASHQVTRFEYNGDGERITAVTSETPDGEVTIEAGAVVLASGGFEADARKRAMYLGKNWDAVKVRGSQYNTGDGLTLALETGAMSKGNWSGAHAVGWEAAAPEFGDRDITNQFSRHSYPFGISVNLDGERFVDEASDLRNYTYAKMGSAILAQPSGMAFQIFDQVGLDYLRTDYGHEGASRYSAATLEDLARQLNIPVERFLTTVKDFNAAIQDGEFDPTRLDGKGTRGITPPKSNWALPISKPPFVAYPITCGITFTFGGIAVDEEGRVRKQAGGILPNLCAAGELVGGLFFDNYAGGSGLMAGAVYGRLAGRTAVAIARASRN
jgi:tricarballylate dehydrogenase